MASTDPILTNLLQRNAKWAKAVEEAEPGFHEAASKGQSPPVSLHPSSFFPLDIAGDPLPVFTRRIYSDVARTLLRCCGLVARIRGSRNRSLLDPSLERFSSIGTSPSTFDQGSHLPCMDT